MKLYFFLATFRNEVFAPQAKRMIMQLSRNSSLVKSYTMPHSLKKKGGGGGQNPLFLLMTLHEKQKSLIVSGLQDFSTTHTWPPKELTLKSHNPYRPEYLITLFGPSNKLSHTMSSEQLKLRHFSEHMDYNH